MFSRIRSGWLRIASSLIGSEDPQLRRRAGMTMFIVAVGAVTGLLSSIVHLAAGDPLRATFTAAYGLPLLLALGFLRLSRNPELTSHLLLAVISLGLLASPFLAADAIRIPLGLLVIPMTAAAATGLRGGIVWSLLCALAFASLALLLPLEPAERTLAWTTTIVCGCLGAGEAWIGRGRIEALAAAKAESRRRAETERSLRESERLFATLFERTPSMLIRADLPDGRILDVNEAFVDLSGWSAEDARGRTLSELGAWPNRTERDRLRDAVIGSRVPGPIELQLQNRRGELLFLLASAEVIDVGGQPQLLAQALDVTERKRNEQALAEYRAELEQRVEESGVQLRESLARLADRERLAAIGTLAAGIAHQINNPIGAITAIAELSLLEDEDKKGIPSQRRAMTRVLAEARRCGRIVRSILQFARDEPTAKWTEDLNPVIRRAGGLSRSYVHSRGGRLSLSLAEEPLPVRISPIAIEQAVVNLLRNAAESKIGGVRVRLETRREEKNAVVAVVDDGRGVSQENAARLVDPFYTTRLDEGGTGLGLSVVHGIVSDHQGELSIVTPEEGGSRFEIHLPLHAEAPSLAS